jgi:hypothetical protein
MVCQLGKELGEHTSSCDSVTTSGTTVYMAHEHLHGTTDNVACWYGIIGQSLAQRGPRIGTEIVEHVSEFAACGKPSIRDHDKIEITSTNDSLLRCPRQTAQTLPIIVTWSNSRC